MMIERITSVTILPPGEALYSEMATRIEIVDEVGGEFVEVSQNSGKIQINPEEWPALRAAIDRMIGECRDTQAGDRPPSGAVAQVEADR